MSVVSNWLIVSIFCLQYFCINLSRNKKYFRFFFALYVLLHTFFQFSLFCIILIVVFKLNCYCNIFIFYFTVGLKIVNMKSTFYFSIFLFHLFYYFFIFLLYQLKQINLLILLQYLLTRFFWVFLTFNFFVQNCCFSFKTFLYASIWCLHNKYTYNGLKPFTKKIIKIVDIRLINPQERECISAQCFIEISLNYVILIRELWHVANKVLFINYRSDDVAGIPMNDRSSN